MYRKRRYRRKSSKPQKLALIGIAAAVTIGAFLTLLNIEKQIDADSASSVQESKSSSSEAEAIPVTDTAGPEKIALVSGEVTTDDGVKLPDEIRQLLLDYTSDKYEYMGDEGDCAMKAAAASLVPESPLSLFSKRKAVSSSFG